LKDLNLIICNLPLNSGLGKWFILFCKALKREKQLKEKAGLKMLKMVRALGFISA
jgi:hypothetical protein